MSAPTGDRRALRRAQTQQEILDLALAEMAEHGVAGLSLSAIARRLGMRPPSLYKYFPSRHAVYDALFRIGQERYRDVTALAGATAAEPGLAALGAALDAGGRWVMANQTLAQLLFWRPVPGFVPSAEAYAAAGEIAATMTGFVADAVERGQLHPDAATDEGADLLRSMITGVLSQQLANEPGATYDEGRFTRLVARLPGLLAAAYPPMSRP